MLNAAKNGTVVELARVRFDPVEQILAGLVRRIGVDEDGSRGVAHHANRPQLLGQIIALERRLGGAHAVVQVQPSVAIRWCGQERLDTNDETTARTIVDDNGLLGRGHPLIGKEAH